MRLLLSAVALVALGVPAVAQDKAADVMKEARAALGGAKFEQLKTLNLEGPFARDMGGRQMTGKVVMTLQLPGNMHRSEDMEIMGGMSIERISALAGDKSWEDQQNRGGMGGGMQVVMRGPGQGELNAEQLEQARLRRFRTEFNRYLLAFFGGAGLQPTYVAVAEAPEGKADVVEVKNEQGQAVRLFVDQNSHMPLMLQYQEVRPRVMMQGGPGGGPGGGGRGFGGGDRVFVGGGGGGRGGGAGDMPPPPPPPPGGGAGRGGEQRQAPDPEEIKRRMASMPPPTPSTVTLFLSEYKKVDGVMLPHRLTYAVDGKTVEEWNIEKVKVNPAVKADLFEKK
jgi:hypothetical protein